MNQNTPTKLQAVLREIWPTVYRIINNSLYFVFSVIRAMLKIAMDQLKNT